MIELTSDEPLVVGDQKGFFGACCILITAKLLQDAIFPVENDLPYQLKLIQNNFDFDDLLGEREVKAVVVVVICACSASLPITQS